MTKKIFAMFLAVLMVVSMLPTSVFAAEACPDTHTLKNCTDYTAVYVKDPNCGEQGYTVYQCNKCSATFVDSWTAPVGEHTWGPGKDEAPTCVKSGVKGGEQCSVCKERKNEETVPALGKDLMDKGYTVSCEWGEWDITEIDCTKKAVQTRYCENCGAKDEEKYEPAQGATHGNWTAWEVLTAPTADQPGQVIRYCGHEGETWTCTGYEIVELHETHKHEDQVMLLVPAVPAADCASTGMKAHYVCRLCNGLFEKKDDGSYKAITADKLVIKSFHTTELEKLDCQNTNTNCEYCGVVLQLDATKAHDMKGWEIVTDFAPTCEINGFEQNKCKNCVYTETRVINALGHQTVTVSVPATCTAYAYTYTFCTRPDCTYGKNVAAADLKLPESHKFEQYGMVKYQIAAIEAVPAADKAFFLTMVQNNPYVMENLFFNGETTTHDYREAAKIFVETVEGGYRLYMKNGETKTYIEIAAENNKVIVKLTAEPKNVYTWDATNKIFTTKLGEKFYFLGASGLDTTISAVELKAENTAFMAKLSPADNALVATKVLSFSVNKDAGVNASAHKLENMTYVAPTCQVTGTRIQHCTLCGKVMDAETLPVIAHKWVADTSKADVAPDCVTAGKKFLKCEFCGLTKEEAVPATGHKLVKNEDGTVKKFEHLGNHKDLLAYDYNVCENANCPVADKRVNKTNQRAWAGAGKIYESETAAKADHTACGECEGTCELKRNDALDVAGDCEIVGYTAYTCSCCGNTVRVKVAGTGDHVGKVVVPADCENASYFVTFKCARSGCGKTIGEGTVGQTKNTVAPALGHDWVENEEYEFAGCDNLVANEIKHCKRTGCGKVVMDKTDIAHVVVGANLCVGFSYDTFKCTVCNEDHMINFVGPLGHEWKEVAGSKTPASCMAPGRVDLVCKYCSVAADTVEGGAALEIIPQLKHKNADGVEFTANCLTKNEHCVLCCECVDEDGELIEAGHDCMKLKDGEFKYDCRCHFKAEQHSYDIVIGKPDCDTLPYYYMYCDLCHKTTAAQSVSEIEIDANTTHKIVVGHRPAVAGDKKYIDRVYQDYGPYTNADATGYWSYTIENDPADEDAVIVSRVWNAKYLAEYIAYKAPTRTEAGYEEYVCAYCGETIRNELKVADELEFIAEFQEGDYTYGSLVKVDIFANGADKEIFAFEFNANFTGMVFVGFDENNTEFVVDTTDPAAGQTMITVNGTAYTANVANKEINGKTWLTTLYFRVNVKDASELTVTLSKKLNADGKHEAATKVEIVDGKLSTTVFEPVFAATAKIKTIAYMDLNGDNKFTFHDVLTGIAMLNLDVEKLYDVAGDIDQDGKFTIADLDMIQDVRLGNATAEELVLNAVSEEEAILMGLLTKCADCETVYEGAECPNKANHK